MKRDISIKNSPSVTIVVEGQRDAQVLRGLLDDSQLKRTRFFAAQGNLSVGSLARNILVHEGSSVVVVVDADGAPGKVESEQSSALGSVAPIERYSIVVFEPSLTGIMASVGLVPNEVISDEQKHMLRAHPQVDNFLKKLAHFEPSREADTQPSVI